MDTTATAFLKTIIVDDEPNNLQYLQLLLADYCPQINILATESNAVNGMLLINELQPDLVLMDIDMPGMTGFEVLKKLEPLSFEVIFVTAYNQYALEAFDFNAIGYITKPINVEKLMTAVTLAEQRIRQKEYSKNVFSLLSAVNQNTALADQKIPLSTQTGLQFISQKDIAYCESSGNYTNFHLLNNKTVLVTRQLGEYEFLLPAQHFIRIHDKYIINLQHIKEYIKGNGGEVVLENGKELPVAARRKEEFLARFSKWTKRR